MAALEQLQSVLGDRYRVERQFGEGGMATVFLAEDLKHHRPVAVKLFKPELSAVLGGDRFLREIEIAARLQHPHIVPLYDSGQADGLLFYVMPLVEGESLRQRLNREQQLPLEDALQITKEVGSALQYAHSHGVVHRDIKPENILLSGGVALVADFGIARALSAAGGEHLTQTGMAIGTPAYMSPEQATATAIDARSDQYSLACTLYEMLIGQPPFTGPSPMAIMARHSLEAVPSLQIVRQSVPDEVEDAIMRAMAKTPADRFPSMQHFVDTLAAAAPRATGRHTAATARKRASSRARPVRIAGVVGTLAVIAAAAVWAVRGGLGGRAAGSAASAGLDPLSIAVLYFRDLSPDTSLAAVADGFSEALIDELRQVRNLRVISRNGVAPYRRRQLPLDSIARVVQAGTLVDGSIEPGRDRLRVQVRLVDGASGADLDRTAFELPARGLLAIRDSLIQATAAVLRRQLGQDVRLRAQRAATASVSAWSLVQQAERTRKDAEALLAEGQSEAALQRLDQVDSLLAAAEREDPEWLEPTVQRGLLAYRRSRLEGIDAVYARPWTEKGLAHAARALDRDSLHAAALELRGTLRYWRWLLGLAHDTRQAARLLDSARADLQQATRLDQTRAGAWNTLSHLEYQVPDPVQAKLAAQRAYEEDAWLDFVDQTVLRLFNASYDLGQFVEADRWCDEGRRRFPGNPRFVMCRLWMLSTRQETADPARAWSLYQELEHGVAEERWPREAQEARIGVAAVLARAGLADSARAVLSAVRLDADIDPSRDLLVYAAFVRTLLGDRDEAIRLLAENIAAHPEHRAVMERDFSVNWWWTGLREDPRFQALTGGSR